MISILEDIGAVIALTLFLSMIAFVAIGLEAEVILVIYMVIVGIVAAIGLLVWMADDSANKFIDYTTINNEIAREYDRMQRIERRELLPEWLNVRRD